MQKGLFYDLFFCFSNKVGKVINKFLVFFNSALITVKKRRGQEPAASRNMAPEPAGAL